jgi:hypothetical protein
VERKVKAEKKGRIFFTVALGARKGVRKEGRKEGLVMERWRD